MESAYTTPKGTSEPRKILQVASTHITPQKFTGCGGSPGNVGRKLWPNTDWVQTWKNLNETPVPETTRSVWYRVIHEIIPSNERLHRINMVQTNTFRQCATKDTLQHCLLVRGEERMMWEYSKP